MAAQNDKFQVSTGGMCANILDMDSGQLRPPLIKDLVEMTKLADSFGMGGVAPVVPIDVPGPFREIALYKICWENSTAIKGAGLTSVFSADYVRRMSQVLDKRFVLHLWISSPLQLLGTDLDILWHLRGQHLAVIPAAMPMLGITAPIFLPAAYMQTIAEVVGGAVIVALLGYDVDFDFDFLVFPSNMREARCVYGSPEHNLLSLMYLQIRRFLGLPIGNYKAFISMAKAPDAQAAAERMAGVLAGALAGATRFYAAGRICLDEIFSAEQLVIDQEIVDYVQRFMAGFELKDTAQSLQTIAEIGPGGDYLTHDTTVESFRDVFWQPRLFGQASLGAWQAQGALSVSEHARQIAKERIAGHHFELDAATAREIEHIYEQAIANVP